MIGKTVSHYKISKQLGEGGMGVVYKAEDTKLKRTVALKFLPPELTRDPEAKERFIREAQAASSLDHTNICTIYEINETDDGQMFIAMACYEGQTLKDKIKDKRLKTEEAIEIVIQIAEGLSRAHEESIIHRDIKPANIIITERNEVKILDFGLAKLAGQVQLTKDSSTLGTVAYMSPEQLSGKEVDHRTDIWSLGVVLYEMLTGELPFKGDYEQALIYSILNEEPIPPSQPCPDIPNNIINIILKTLEKNKENRFKNVQALINELKTPSNVIPDKVEKEKSIIVLPFVNMSPDPEQEYFSDGLTEEIITDLSQIHNLLVISRSSAMTFKGSQKKITEIAKEVNVQFVLEGSVRKASNNLRITAQLIDATQDTHLWAEKYNGTLEDVFEIQEKVSKDIADKLKLKLSPEEKEKMRIHQIQDMRALECWLRAKQEIHHYTEESFDKAVSLIEDGLNVIGNNVLLFWGLGYINWFYVNMGIYLDSKYLDKAEEYVGKIFKLDPSSFYGYQLLGLIAYKRADVNKSIQYTKQSLEIEPNNPEALDHLIWMYAIVGKTEKSTQLIDRLLSIDPLTPHNHWANGLTLMVEGRIDDSIKSFSRCYELDSENTVWMWFYAYGFFINNDQSNANSIVNMMEKQAPDDFFTKFIVFIRFAITGNKEKALQMIPDGLETFGKWDEIISLILAQCYSMIGAKQEALKWVENTINRGFINYPFLSEYDPFLHNLRGDERFEKLMERVKFEWENFKLEE